MGFQTVVELYSSCKCFSYTVRMTIGPAELSLCAIRVCRNIVLRRVAHESAFITTWVLC